MRRGLFHPDDIKTVGLTSTTPGPLSAPLPTLMRKASRPSLSPVTTPNSTFGPSSAGLATHSRSASLAAPLGSGGSFGRTAGRGLQNHAEFGKYAEDDDEDYEDVFGKLNGTGMFRPYSATFSHIVNWDVAIEHTMQTLQLNTRLSNKSWVSCFIYLLVFSHLIGFSSETRTPMKRIRLQRYGWRFLYVVTSSPAVRSTKVSLKMTWMRISSETNMRGSAIWSTN